MPSRFPVLALLGEPVKFSICGCKIWGMTPTQNSLSASNGASLEVVTRDEARKARLTRYYTGEPCKHGHFAERLTRDGFCTECKRIRRAAYTLARGAEENANRAAYYREHRAEELARKARYNDTARTERTATENRRRAKKHNAIPAWSGELDDLAFSEAYELAKLRELATGFPWNVDHMIPLQAKNASGLHVGVNLQVIPEALNLAKKNKMILTTPGEWIARS